METKSSILLLLLIVASAAAQEPGRYAERIEVRIVDLEVIVTDRSGNPVTGLTRDDFEVLEEGKQREITHFAEIRWDTPAPETAPQRAVVVFIDNATLSRTARKWFFRALPEFVTNLTREGIPVSIVVWTERLEVRVTFSKDAPVLRQVIHTMEDDETLLMHHLRYQNRRRTLEPPLLRMIERKRQRALLAAFHQLTTTADTRARKALLYVGEGFPNILDEEETVYWEAEGFGEPFPQESILTPIPRQPEVPLPSDQRLSRAVDRRRVVEWIANRDGITLYGVYGGGLEAALPEIDWTARSMPRALLSPLVASAVTSLNVISDSTGGTATGTTNHFNPILGQVHSDLTSYYSLAYRTEAESGPEVRKIKVRLKDPTHRLRHRREVVLQ